jgi:hypothetical protein
MVACCLQFAQRLEGMLERGAVHPKMEKLQDILVQHFTALQADAALPGSTTGGSRVIIFTTLRESVNSIVALLKRKAPLISARSTLHVVSQSLAIALQRMVPSHSVASPLGPMAAKQTQQPAVTKCVKRSHLCVQGVCGPGRRERGQGQEGVWRRSRRRRGRRAEAPRRGGRHEAVGAEAGAVLCLGLSRLFAACGALQPHGTAGWMQ